MTTVAIFILGVIVMGITVTAVVLVGLGEAADPAQSRPEDLTDWERSLVGSERQRNVAKRGET